MNNIFIDLEVNKEPYTKQITNDKVINLTGESGSGKSYYANRYINDESYIVIDTDEVFSRYEKSNGVNREFGNYIRSKYKILPSLFEDFDLIYEEIINYFKARNKTIIIDSAQFRNLKSLNKLKGSIIIMRTSIDTCYQRCIDRYKNNNPNASKEELDKYLEKKKKIYNWYKSLNDFILKVDKL